MKRERAVAVYRPGLAAALALGYARRRSPAPVIVADPRHVEAREIASWYGSELVFDDDPVERAAGEARARSIGRVYAPEVADGSADVDWRNPTEGLSACELIGRSTAMFVPLHLIPRCVGRCDCVPTCAERAAAFELLAMSDPHEVRTSVAASAPLATVTKVHLVGSRFTGSTVFGLCLETHPSVFVAGELMSLTADYGKRLHCTCRVPLDSCGFWAPLMHERRAAVGPDNVDELMERVGRVAGASVVVDSSKHASWVEALPEDDDRSLIHLVRDGRAVAASAGRRPDTSVEDGAREWLNAHTRALPLTERFGDRCLRIHYEDFAADPLAAANRVFRWLGLDEVAHGFEHLTDVVSHQVRGNPARFRRRPIELDTRWRDELSKADLAELAAIVGPMQQTLGYDSAV